MKRKLALLLAGMMVVGTLAGCGSKGEEAAAPAAAEETTEAAGAAEEVVDAQAADDGSAAAAAIEERKASGNVPKVVIAYMNFAGTPKGIDRISAKMSEITEEKLGVDVELQIMDAASYAQNMNLMLASGEQVDLFNTVSVGFMPCVNKGYLMDLEEDDLLANYGQDIIAAFKPLELNANRVNGTLYGIPVKKDDAAGQFGISIPAMSNRCRIDLNSSPVSS